MRVRYDRLVVIGTAGILLLASDVFFLNLFFQKTDIFGSPKS